MRINKKLYIPASISSGLILFLILISSAASAAPVTCNVAGTNYQYEYFGQYPVMNLFGEKYVPILNDDNPIWKSHVNKLAKLVLDTDTKYNLKPGDKIDLGDGYTLKAMLVYVDSKKVWLEFEKDGMFVDDLIVSTDSGNGTLNYKLDNVQYENNVPVLKIHVNKIFQGAVDSIAQINGLWLIDYANTTNLKVGDKFKGYTLTKINNGVKQSNLGSLVFEVPRPVAVFSATPTSGTFPLIVSFTDKSTGSPTSWKWTFGDGNTSTVKNPTHKYSKAGNYTVSLKVSNAAGNNTTTKTNYIKVIAKPVAAFSASLTSGKVPLTVVFKDKSTGSPTSWRWSFGDGAVKTSQNPTHKYTKKGIYTVSLTVKNAAGSNTITKSKYITVK